MKVVSIVGARPQFIKAAVVNRAFQETKLIQEVIVHTGQHFDTNMSDVFFQEMHIPKYDYNLNISNLSHGAMTGRMLEKIEEVLLFEKPDFVLVYGDTNSTLAGALAAKKLHINIAHVEAGLRSYNIAMPEEVNRIITDRISDTLFCPTQRAVDNLIKEGFDTMNCSVINSGDVMQDAALYYAPFAKKPSIEIPPKFLLCTVHRTENTDNKDTLTEIMKSLEEISNHFPTLLPLHPRTKSKLEAIGYNFKQSKLLFIDPVSYFEMIYLLQHCQLVLTDSGGLQKEAYFFQKKCVTLRNETEWVELIDSGCNMLAGTSGNRIVSTYKNLFEKEVDFFQSLYGKGNAGQIIAEQLLSQLMVKG